MILTLHIIVAIAGIASATILVVRPTVTKMRLSSSFAVGTLLSGVVLTIAQPSHLVQACLTGLAYFAVVGTLIAISWRKLATVSNS